MVMLMEMSRTKHFRQHECTQNAAVGSMKPKNTIKGRTKARFHFSNIRKRDRYVGPGVFVWGGIMLKGWTEVHICYRVSVPENRYCKERILRHVCLFRGAIGQTAFLWRAIHAHAVLLIFNYY
ncbi:hypothetical protein TNCV_1198301 [Trichonephila clavipes]|uniref:Uncharacterized protein n=1 Tax=Trichonephila clavipes TaxID=2585209 RepID=A0A8X6RY55_TRICX|nr:hypothetical protein TNCV_1198301 [Trichonephila clavipes]